MGAASQDQERREPRLPLSASVALSRIDKALSKLTRFKGLCARAAARIAPKALGSTQAALLGDAHRDFVESGISTRLLESFARRHPVAGADWAQGHWRLARACRIDPWSACRWAALQGSAPLSSGDVDFLAHALALENARHACPAAALAGSVAVLFSRSALDGLPQERVDALEALARAAESVAARTNPQAYAKADPEFEKMFDSLSTGLPGMSHYARASELYVRLTRSAMARLDAEAIGADLDAPEPKPARRSSL